MAAAWEGDASVAAELLKHGANATLVIMNAGQR